MRIAISSLMLMARSVRTRRGLVNALMSIGALLTLVALIAVFDERVRKQLSSYAGVTPSTEPLSAASSAVVSLATVIFVAMRDQSIAHAPLVIFVLAATVLLLFMLRT